MEKNKDNKKKPLKLSSSGRLQIRKNLGPSSNKAKQSGNKKTIQIVFRNKNTQQKSTSTTKSNFRGSSISRPMANPIITPGAKFQTRPNKNFSQKNKKNVETKKTLTKKQPSKPNVELNEKTMERVKNYYK